MYQHFSYMKSTTRTTRASVCSTLQTETLFLIGWFKLAHKMSKSPLCYSAARRLKVPTPALMLVTSAAHRATHDVALHDALHDGRGNDASVPPALPRHTRGRYHGGRRPSSDDSLHSPTVIPPSALDEPSIMKRYNRRRT